MSLISGDKMRGRLEELLKKTSTQVNRNEGQEEKKTEVDGDFSYTGPFERSY